MHLLLINGSPRSKKSNTRFILEKFCEGFTETQGNSCEHCYLYLEDNLENLAAKVFQSEYVMIGFPLYIDAMPSKMKEFIEVLANYTKTNKPKVLFLVQSGFSESIHSSFIERYLEINFPRIGFDYIGTIRRGAGEGLKDLPDIMTRNINKKFIELGRQFGSDATLNQKIIKKLLIPKRQPLPAQIQFNLLWAPLINYMSWFRMYKKNNSSVKYYDRPYL